MVGGCELINDQEEVSVLGQVILLVNANCILSV